MTTPITIELFSCSGGMAAGFRAAGFAPFTYNANLGHAPVQMDVRDLLRLVEGGWSPGPVRLLVADPPCTPWSRAGKRLGTADERDMLHQTADLIAALRPAAYLIGNVPGLDDATQWHVVQEVLGSLQRVGYCIADYASLDAANYGVPQHRVRPFWFGHLTGPCLTWPAPTHCDPDELLTLPLPGVPALRPWMTCHDALSHLPLAELGRPVRMKPAQLEGDSAHGGTWDNHPPSQPDAPSHVIKTNGGRNSGAAACLSLPGIKGNKRHPPASPASPAATISAKDRGQSTVLMVGERQRTEGHPLATPDGLAPTFRGGGSGHSAPEVILAVPAAEAEIDRSNSRQNGMLIGSTPDKPARTVGEDSRHHGRLLNVDTPAERAPDVNRPLADLDAPHRTILSTSRDTALLELPKEGWHHPHPCAEPDRPAPIITTQGGRAGERATTLRVPEAPKRLGQGMRTGAPDAPSATVTAQAARIGAGAGKVLEWPWNRPCSTESGSILSQANAIVLSEKAATILQGFPEDWTFAGKTKKARWSQLGQAMPPALAAAVARAILAQLAAGDAAAEKSPITRAWRDLEAEADRG